MLHIEDEQVRLHLLQGNFGLEKESLRVTGDGAMAHTPHPFPGDPYIVRDFCENQTEINTGVHPSAAGAVEELRCHHQRIIDTLQALPEKEYLWPSSNPPFLRNEEDIPVAQFTGEQAGKTVYRNYLSDKYGRYKMTFSGIHVNYSFSDELLAADWEAGGKTEEGFVAHRSRLYLDLAQALVSYGWILTALTAASPVLDSSYFEKGGMAGADRIAAAADRQSYADWTAKVAGASPDAARLRRSHDVFTGMASVRSSELGYWNAFAPIFDYRNERAYADSVEGYIRRGFVQAASELYYPIRLKPPGENTLANLREGGIDHIELRMFDLNPLDAAGLDKRDVLFAQLLIIYLACTPHRPLTDSEQVQAVQNYKNAARYDLKTVKIVTPDGESVPAADAGERILGRMRSFFRALPEGKPFHAPCPDFPEGGNEGLSTIDKIEEILDFEYGKITNPMQRYAWQIRSRLHAGHSEDMLALAKERQDRQASENVPDESSGIPL